MSSQRLLSCFKLSLIAFLSPAYLSVSQPVVLRDALVIKSLGRAGRSAVHTDALESQIIHGQWQRPAAGEGVIATDGREEVWELARADKEGWFEGSALHGGYLYWPLNSTNQQVALLEAAGHNLAYVNGEIRVGDPYAYDYVRLPVLLHAGTNDLLFQCARGRFRARIASAPLPLLIETNDATLPDLVVGESGPVWGAVVLLNATTNPVTARLRVMGKKKSDRLISIPPLGLRKAPFLFYPPRFGQLSNCVVSLEAALRTPRACPPVRAQLTLRVRQPGQTYKRTFLSTIDDSVQYYAVNPPPPESGNSSAPALFLSVHGASVEAIGQADAYSPKKWGCLVCPTNRRPYGFDWEEWGRMDAMEVLGLAEARFRPDPSRIYLTGHSMGGHGTWQLGALYPDHFAAIGPSAGWISFSSYVSTNRSPATNAMEQLLVRAAATSHTLIMATNYLQEGVYIIHGSADDNVPVTEARHMRDLLSTFHHDFVYHEQPGVGHWWDVSDEPGADCVDWAPLFDFFAHHALPADDSLRRIQFITVNPAVSSRCHWVTILAQERQLAASYIDVRCDPGKRRLIGTTKNISKLVFELPLMTPGLPLEIELDGQKIENIPWPGKAGTPFLAPRLSNFVCLARSGAHWELAGLPESSMKTPLRAGPFRQAFCNHMVFVYATHGSAAENAWALTKARYDAESFYYRGNGSVALLTDTECAEAFQRRRRDRSDPNVILYGNADNNSAWPVLLPASPVQIHRHSIRIGAHELAGDDLACLFLQPLPHSDKALVGVVSGTGLPGLRLTERLPYFVSGAGFPDCLVIDSKMLLEGPKGLRAVGFFGNDWSVANGEFAWGAE